MGQEQFLAYQRPRNDRARNNVKDCIGNHLGKFRDASQCWTVTAFRTLSRSQAQIEVLPSSRANHFLRVRTGPKRSMPSQSIHLEFCESRSMALPHSLVQTRLLVDLSRFLAYQNEESSLVPL